VTTTATAKRTVIGSILNGSGRGSSLIYRGSTKAGVRYWRWANGRMFPISEVEVMQRLIPAEVTP